jgi:hypothetical protein
MIAATSSTMGLLSQRGLQIVGLSILRRIVSCAFPAIRSATLLQIVRRD